MHELAFWVTSGQKPDRPWWQNHGLLAHQAVTRNVVPGFSEHLTSAKMAMGDREREQIESGLPAVNGDSLCHSS